MSSEFSLARGADCQRAEQMKAEDQGVSNQRHVLACILARILSRILTLRSRRRHVRDIAIPGKTTKVRAMRELFTNTTKFGIGACFRDMSKLLAFKADCFGTVVGKVTKAITLPTSVLSVMRETYLKLSKAKVRRN